ncbi:MAG: hypothetical protein LBR78_01320, partial [Holosporales bacterium]|nr:hypothetical protein [Holosporales bacterium]
MRGKAQLMLAVIIAGTMIETANVRATRSFASRLAIFNKAPDSITPPKNPEPPSKKLNPALLAAASKVPVAKPEDPQPSKRPPAADPKPAPVHDEPKGLTPQQKFAKVVEIRQQVTSAIRDDVGRLIVAMLIDIANGQAAKGVSLRGEARDTYNKIQRRAGVIIDALRGQPDYNQVEAEYTLTAVGRDIPWVQSTCLHTRPSKPAIKAVEELASALEARAKGGPPPPPPPPPPPGVNREPVAFVPPPLDDMFALGDSALPPPVSDDSDDEPAPVKKKSTKKVVDSDDDEPAPRKSAASKKKPAPAKKAVPVSDDSDEEPAPVRRKSTKKVVDSDDEKPAPRKSAASKKKPAPAKKAVPVSDDSDEDPAPRRKSTKKVVDSDDDEPAPRKSAASKKKAAAPVKKV